MLILQSSCLGQHKKKKRDKSADSVVKLPLFVIFAITIILFVMSRTLLDYSLKFVLSAHYSKAQIGSYSSIIYAFSQTVIIVLGLFAVKPTISFFGTPIVTVLAPFLTLFTCIGEVRNSSIKACENLKDAAMRY